MLGCDAAMMTVEQSRSCQLQVVYMVAGYRDGGIIPSI